MPQIQSPISASIGGVSISRTISRTGSGVIAVEETLPAAKAGTLTTRTDDNTGEATLSGGHGITDGMIVDVYWSGGVRYGMTVGTVASNVVPIDLGAGDVLPAQATAITLVQQVPITVSIDGDNVKHITFSIETTDTSLTTKGHILFEDAAGDDIAEIDLTANEPQQYDIQGGAITNPFTGDPITIIRATNANSSVAATLKIVGVYDATP